MSGENTEISWDRIDITDSTDRRFATGISGTLTNLTIKKRAERRRQKLRAELVREQIESMNRAPTLLQALIARFIR
ncbi:MAG: hypothetical protein JSU67_10595 [Gammaproteobacteria bacterium]|nr:MAG: hypothetical protein JSU67_10595 [Gammaproteobacteria bacterium]